MAYKLYQLREKTARNRLKINSRASDDKINNVNVQSAKKTKKHEIGHLTIKQKYLTKYLTQKICFNQNFRRIFATTKSHNTNHLITKIMTTFNIYPMSEYDHIVVKGNKSAYLRALNKGCAARFVFKVVEMSEETRKRLISGADCGIHEKSIVDGKTLVQWCYQHVCHHMDMIYGRRFDTKTLAPYKYISVSTASIWRGERR